MAVGPPLQPVEGSGEEGGLAPGCTDWDISNQVLDRNSETIRCPKRVFKVMNSSGPGQKGQMTEGWTRRHHSPT